MPAVNLIGKGRIGQEVAAFLAAPGPWQLQSLIGRQGGWQPAPLTIDTAGPQALRAHGGRLLEQGDLWTVGAAALIDPVLRAELQAASAQSGHALRLFTGWISGPSLLPSGVPGRLHVTQSAPRLGPEPGLVFAGPLSEAAARFPDHLNTATGAALCGPGIDATTIELISTEDGGPHVIAARLEMPGQVITSEVRFHPGAGPHPVAAALIAALEARSARISYG